MNVIADIVYFDVLLPLEIMPFYKSKLFSSHLELQHSIMKTE